MSAAAVERGKESGAFAFVSRLIADRRLGKVITTIGWTLIAAVAIAAFLAPEPMLTKAVGFALVKTMEAGLITTGTGYLIRGIDSITR